MRGYSLQKKIAVVARVILAAISLGALVAAPASAGLPPYWGWDRLHDPTIPGGEIRMLAMAPSNPDILYVDLTYPYTNFGLQDIFRSQDGGQSWQKVLLQKLSINSLAVDPQDPNILYGAQSNGLLQRSIDGGATWWPFYSFGFRVAAPAPGRIYLLGATQSDGCIFASYEFARSLDGGQTWQYVPVTCDDESADQMFVNPSNPDQVFLSGHGKPSQTWESLDGGLTWQVLLFDGQNMGADDITYDPANTGRIFLAGQGVWGSSDHGATWTACGTLLENSPFHLQYAGGNLFLSSTDFASPQDVRSNFYRSDDQCASWWKSTTVLPANVSNLLVDPGIPGKLLVGTSGYGVFQSTNNGATWQETNTGLSSYAVISQMAVAPNNPRVILAGGLWPRPAVYLSTDGGTSWTGQVFDKEPLSILIQAQDPLQAWVATKDAIYYSDNSANWARTYFGAWPVHTLIADPQDPDHPFALVGDGQQGFILHWEQFANEGLPFWLPYMIPGATDIQSLAINPSNSLDRMVGGIEKPGFNKADSVLYHSLDGGKTWRTVFRKDFYSVPITQILIDPANPQYRYFLLETDRIYRSTDGGETWIDWSGGTFLTKPIFASNLAVDAFGGVYFFSWTGVYHRSVTETNWTTVTSENSGIFTGAYWRGDTPFVLAAGWDGLWRLSLPTIRRTWFPVVGK